MNKLDFKELTYGCCVTDKEDYRIYEVIGWDEEKGFISVKSGRNKSVGSINNYKGIELTEKRLLSMLPNVKNPIDTAKEYGYVHMIQRLHLALNNEVLKYTI